MSLEETNVIPLPVHFKPHPVAAPTHKPREPLSKLGALAASHGDALDNARLTSPGVRAIFGDNSHVCPSLIRDLASRINGVASMVAILADEAKSLREPLCVLIRENASDLETIAANMIADLEPLESDPT